MNVSNGGNLETDSGYKFYNILAEEILALGNEFIFAGPRQLSCQGAGFIPLDFGDNKYETRFGFQMQRITEILEQTCPDVLIVNQVELVPHFAICLEKLHNTSTKIVAYAHYIPFAIQSSGALLEDSSLNARGLNKIISHAFISGLETADLVLVHSKTAMHTIMQGCTLLARPFKGKLEILPPPRDPNLVQSQFGAAAFSNTLIYNHRLYAHYGTAELCALLPHLTAQGYQVKILDILGHRNPERRSMDNSPELYRAQLTAMDGVELYVNGLYGQPYRTMLEQAKIGLAPLRENCSWSMSCIDLMAMGKPVLAPDLAWFSEVIPPELRYEHHTQAAKIAYRLLSDPDFYARMSDACAQATKHLTPDLLAQRMNKLFMTLLNHTNANRTASADILFRQN